MENKDLPDMLDNYIAQLQEIRSDLECLEDEYDNDHILDLTSDAAGEIGNAINTISDLKDKIALTLNI